MFDYNALNANKQRFTFPVFFLGVFLCFVFYCNHNALFISDYYLPIVFFVLAALFYFYKYNIPLRLTKQHYCILGLFALICIVSYVNSQYLDKGVLLSYAVWFVFYSIAILLPVNKRDINFLINSFIVGALICGLIVIIVRYEYRWPGTGRYSIHFEGQEAIDPNYLATFMIIGGTLSFAKILKKEKTKLDYLLMITGISLITVAVIMTGSRGSVLAYVVSLMGIFIKFFLENKHKIKFIHVILFLSACLVGVILLLKFLPKNITDRIFHMNLEDGSNALRVAHWKAAFECFLQRPFFGYGAMLTLDTLQIFANHVGDAHNTYLTILLQFGVVGFILFIIIFIDVIKYLFNKDNVVFLFLLLGQAFSGFIIANHLGISLWMTVLLCYYVGKDYKKQKTEENNEPCAKSV